MTFMDFLTKLDNLAWGVPMLILIMGTGLLLTVRLGVLQFRKLGLALRYMVKNEKDGVGEVTSFGALCTALSATVGTGNIVGVAGAMLAGTGSGILDVYSSLHRYGYQICRRTSCSQIQSY